MISEVVMPQMGADMTEGTLLRWLKQEGDNVSRGEVIAEIETDKADVEIEAFESGIFRRTLADEGDTIQVGEVIAIIAGAEDDISNFTGSGAVNGAAASPARVAGTNGAPVVEATSVQAPPPVAAPAPGPKLGAKTAGGAAPPADEGRVRASPLARRIATERGIDLRQVRGSGPDGRIVKSDVDTLAATPAAARRAPTPSAPAPGAEPTPVAMSKMRQAIARRTSQSKREAPHYYLLLDIDMTAAMALRKQINDTLEEDARVSINDMIVRACAIALQRHAEFNATIEGDVVSQHPAQNICIGIALDEGLIAPAVLDAGSRSLVEIAAASKDLVDRAKNGSLRPDEISAGTFTISNLGAYGVETLIGIIQPPQTAILGVGAVADSAAVRDGEVTVRQVMKVALSADHRVTDGAQGARFLTTIKETLEKPLSLLL